MSAMGRTLITRAARLQVLALDDDARDAVNAAIEDLSEDSGESIDLPTAPEGAEYLAVPAGETVILYREAPESQGGGLLVISLLSPDAYEELRRTSDFLTSQPEQDVENTPFTSAEQAEVSAQVRRVEDYIKATFELTSEQISRVEETLSHAEEASRHLGRKDWLLLFNGGVFSLILTDMITPQAAQHIIMLTVQGLGHLFGFGGPPPHLPPAP
jgi:hypothetical protein